MSITPNSYPLNLSSGLSGPLYTITGIGGFDISQNFPKITLASVTSITKYDVTNAVQVVIDVNVFNNKLGEYNSTTNRFQNDNITITAAEFLQDVSSANQIVSVGYLSSIYSDFAVFTNNYFNYSSSLPSIFSSTAPFSYNNGIFNSSAFINIINAHTPDSSGGYIQALSGSITINNINQLIQYAHDSNIFGNRVYPPTSASISSGFKDSDLIFISPTVTSAATGIRAYLNLNIDTSLISYDNTSHSYSTTTGSGALTTVSQAVINKINITRYVPLLLILKNFPYP